jgi:hypothetical protein
MQLSVLVSFVSIKEVRNGYKGGGGHVLLAKYNFNLSYIFIKNPIFLYNFSHPALNKNVPGIALHLLVGQMSQFHFLWYPHLHFLSFS